MRPQRQNICQLNLGPMSCLAGLAWLGWRRRDRLLMDMLQGSGEILHILVNGLGPVLNVAQLFQRRVEVVNQAQPLGCLFCKFASLGL